MLVPVVFGVVGEKKLVDFLCEKAFVFGVSKTLFNLEKPL